MNDDAFLAVGEAEAVAMGVECKQGDTSCNLQNMFGGKTLDSRGSCDNTWDASYLGT